MDRSFVTLDAEACADLPLLLASEWWLANGIGGYAAGTVSGALSRRYHGLLVAPVQPPLGRQLLFTKADAVLYVGDRAVPLHCNQWDAARFAALVSARWPAAGLAVRG
jgi:4-alpha-glucanotransferase